MRILLIANYRKGVGGISGQVYALQKHLSEEGHSADIFSTKGSVRQRLEMPSRLKHIVHDYDVIHIHCCSGWGFLPAILGIRAAKKNGKRTVLTYHGGEAEKFFRRHKRLVRHYLLLTDKNIVLSGFLGRVFDQYQIPYTIIPNIVELDDSVYRERAALEPNYICIRSHEKIYNIPCILKAFKLVQEKIPNARLTLLGDGTLHEVLMRQAEGMGLKNVVFTGRVDNSAIYEHLNQADIMVSAPTIDNMPVSILEGFNSGLLVISSNVGGVPYMITDGTNGLLFESNNSNMLADRMLYAYSHQKEVREMIDNAYKGLSKYSWKSVRSKYLELCQC